MSHRQQLKFEPQRGRKDRFMSENTHLISSISAITYGYLYYEAYKLLDKKLFTPELVTRKEMKEKIAYCLIEHGCNTEFAQFIAERETASAVWAVKHLLKTGKSNQPVR